MTYTAPIMFPVEIIITLQTGEVICRQTWHEVKVGPGHCRKLAIEQAKKRAAKEVAASVKVEVVT